MAAAPGQQHGRAAAGRAAAGSGPAFAAGDLAQRRPVDVELARVHLLEEAGDGRRVRGRHAVAQHLDGPERAEVVVALVVERVVQRGGGVDDLGVQLRGRRRSRESSQSRSARNPINACRAAGTASRSSSSSATVRGNHTARASATWARVQWPEAPVDAVLVVERGRDQRRFHREAAAPGPRHDVQPEAVADDRRTPPGRRGRRRVAPGHPAGCRGPPPSGGRREG